MRSSPTTVPMTRSQFPPLRPRRTKPITCGNQKYCTGSDRSWPMSSASLFSKPSPALLENGRSLGSTQTRRTARAGAVPAAGAALLTLSPPASRNAAAAARRSTILLRNRHLPGGPLRPPLSSLLIEALGPAATEHAVRPRFQIGVDVVDVQHDVRNQPKGGHDVLGRGVDVGPAVDHDVVELFLAHALERAGKVGRIGAAGAVRPVAAQAGFGVAPPTIVSLL